MIQEYDYKTWRSYTLIGLEFTWGCESRKGWEVETEVHVSEGKFVMVLRRAKDWKEDPDKRKRWAEREYHRIVATMKEAA